MKIEKWRLTQRQSLSLENVIKMTKARIWNYALHLDGKMYVAFSGGWDSTILLDITRQLFPDCIAVFNDTGLEYPEVKQFALSVKNLVVLKPKKSFLEVIQNYGYPVISKDNAQKIDEIRNTKSIKLWHKRMYGDVKGHGKLSEKWKFMLAAPFKISDRCCYHLKHGPAISFEKKSGNSAIVGTMAMDSRNREAAYLRHGCMNIGAGRNMLTPMSFWTPAHTLEYVQTRNLPVSKIYSMGYKHTGCMFCAFGCDQETPGEGKFALMSKTHPQMFKYCMENLGLRDIFKFMGVKIFK